MHTCALGRCQLGHAGLLLLSDEFGMVVAANLPKMACQLSCGFVCVCLVLGANGSFHQPLRVHLGPPGSRGVPAEDLAPLGSTARTQTLCWGCASPPAET